MKILVTGYKGFIGGNLAQYFMHKGHEVDGFDYVPEVLPNVEAYDWIVHCGALSSTTETDVDKVWKMNYEFTTRLLQLCDKFGTNLQISSTANLYGNINGKKPIKETDPVLPVSPYAWSKYLVDRLLEEAGINEFQMNVQVFRYFNVYGPGESHKGDQASPITKFTEQAINKKEITLFENSDQYYRDFVCVYDVGYIQEAMLHQDVSDIFNIGTGKPRSFQEIADIIAKKHGAKIKYVPMPDNMKAQYQKYTCADNTKIHNAMPIRRWYTVEEFIDVTKT